MEFRLAAIQDLPKLKAVYTEITENMDRNGLQIWDDIYPCAFLEGDILNNRLYVLIHSVQNPRVFAKHSSDRELRFAAGEIISAFALLDTNAGEKALEWKDNQGKALYLDRFGVNVSWQKRGIGSFMLEKARETAKKLGAQYLRLFVVDVNEPAVSLYLKNGFTKANGIYYEAVDDDVILREYGFETAL